MRLKFRFKSKSANDICWLFFSFHIENYEQKEKKIWVKTIVHFEWINEIVTRAINFKTKKAKNAKEENTQAPIIWIKSIRWHLGWINKIMVMHVSAKKFYSFLVVNCGYSKWMSWIKAKRERYINYDDDDHINIYVILTIFCIFSLNQKSNLKALYKMHLYYCILFVDTFIMLNITYQHRVQQQFLMNFP